LPGFTIDDDRNAARPQRPDHRGTSPAQDISVNQGNIAAPVWQGRYGLQCRCGAIHHNHLGNAGAKWVTPDP
jgi:hypothetical protein